MRATPDSKPLHVLVADDDPTVLRTLAQALRSGGYLVSVATDGADAIRLADEQPPDIGLIDLRMPLVDGIDVVRALKERSPERPVLVLSGTNDAEQKLAAFDAGADDFVEKPFSTRELLKRLEAHARHYRTTVALTGLGRHADHLRVMASEATALLAHDLNNGLCVVKANLEYLAATLAPEIERDAESNDAATSAQRALVRMITLVRNFVDIARMEDAVLKPSRALTNVAEIVGTVAQIHLPRRSGSNIELVVDVDQRLSASIDATLLERILHNLLSNAARYVNRGGTIRIGATLTGPSSRPVLVIAVGNTGPAIPAALADSLFDKYAKGGDRRAQSGMGLYFCRLAAEAHGGSIGLKSTAGFGVDIELKLPLPPTMAQGTQEPVASYR